MQNRDTNASIRQKLGSILGLNTSRGPQQLLQRIDELGRPEQGTFFTADVLRELDSTVPLQQRVRALRELHEIVATKHLEEHAVEAVWNTIKDLIHPNQPPNVRHQALTFITALIKGQYEDIGVFRAHFFDVVKNHEVKEDTAFRLLMLQVLTKSGRDIQYMEDKIGPFLLSWTPHIFSTDRATEFLTLLIGVIHYNAAYIDEDVLSDLVQLTCAEARGTKYLDFIEKSLDLLSAVVCYSSLPIDALQAFTITVCHTLNIERFIERSLEVVLKLLATHLGRSAIYTMCDMLKDSPHPHDPLLMRGAVFYVSMSLWGIRRVYSLDLTFSMVLPYIRQAACSQHTIVVYEAALSISRLVRKYHIQLSALEWDHIYAIMEAIYNHALLQPGSSPHNSLIHCIGELVSNIENLYNIAEISIGSPDHFFAFMELCKEALPLNLVTSLLMFKARTISALGEGWVQQLHCLMEKFYRREGRAMVRMEALKVLGKFLEQHFTDHEDQLMAEVVLPMLQPITEDPDQGVRCRAVQMLVQLVSDAGLTSSLRLLDVINTMLQKGIELTAVRKLAAESWLPSDCKAAVEELILVLKAKLHKSSSLAEQIYNLLMRYLQQLYDSSLHSALVDILKLQIFNCVLTLRSNEYGQLGFIDKDRGASCFSPFYVCTPPLLDGSDGRDHFVPKTLNFRTAFVAVVACLEQEWNWDVLTLVLDHLKGLLEDRTLTVAGMPDLTTLCVELCQLMDERIILGRLVGTVGVKNWKAELAAFVYPVLGNLCTYPSHLSRNAQQILVSCLEAGLVGPGAQPCVAALHICLLELQATMKRMLPRVLYRMGQVVATPTMALPVLEFLQSIISVPEMYWDFVEKEYLSVFGVALAYTDPKYNTYIVITAHRVVALWFTCSRTQYRPALAKFITKTLLSNLGHPRCGFFTSPQVHIPKQKSSTHLRSAEEVGAAETLCSELAEVCLDMLARYTYSNLSTQLCRSAGLGSLFHTGCCKSKTWIVGNSLVTVTTSGHGSGGGTCMVCTNQKGTSPHPFSTNSRPSSAHCLAQGWAEMRIRKPTGAVSWLLKVQNRLQIYSTAVLRDWCRTSDWDLVLFNQLGIEPQEDSYMSPGSRPIASVLQPPFVPEKGVSQQGATPSASLVSTGVYQQGATPSASLVSAGVYQQGATPSASLVSAGMSQQGAMPSAPFVSPVDRCPHEATLSHTTVPLPTNVKDSDPLTPKVSEAPSSDPLTPKVSEAPSSDLLTPKVSEAPSSDPLTPKVSEAPSSDPLTPKVSEAPSSDSLTPKVSYTLSLECVSTIEYEEDGDEEEEEEEKEDGEEEEEEEKEDGEEEKEDGEEKGHHSIPPNKWMLHSLAKRHSTSLSWSEGGDSHAHILQRHVSMSSVSMELLPPLLSYDNDESTVLGRSPSLCGKQDLLSEEQQINLVVRFAAQSDVASDGGRSDVSTDDSANNIPKMEDVGHSDPSEELPGVSTVMDGAAVVCSNMATPGEGLPTPGEGLPIPKERLPTPGEGLPTPGEGLPTPGEGLPIPGEGLPTLGEGQATSGKRTGRDQNDFATEEFASSHASSPPEDSEVYNDPSFIFLQFFYSSTLGTTLGDTPLLVSSGEATARAMKLLDLIPPYDTHKIGIIYVDKDQTQEHNILANTHCSSRYMDMLKGLGQLVDIQNCSSDAVYLGGLDQSGADGQFTYFYEDSITQVVYHVATLMPSLPPIPQCKKLHIGNDYVTIVYNNSTKPYTFGTIKGQFNFVEVVVEPLLGGMNRVFIQAKKGLEEMLHLQTALVSDTWLPILVREKALQANLVSLVHQSRAAPEHYLSNWLGRLRSIKRIREKCISEQSSPQGASFGLPDFTVYSS